MGHRSLQFDADSERFHPETNAIGEVPKGENSALKRRANLPAINMIVTEHQECKNHWTRNTYMYKPEAWP